MMNEKDSDNRMISLHRILQAICFGLAFVIRLSHSANSAGSSVK